MIKRERKAFPLLRHYDLPLRLGYLRRVGFTHDERMAEAIELVASKRNNKG